MSHCKFHVAFSRSSCLDPVAVSLCPPWKYCQWWLRFGTALTFASSFWVLRFSATTASGGSATAPLAGEAWSFLYCSLYSRLLPSDRVWQLTKWLMCCGYCMCPPSLVATRSDFHCIGLCMRVWYLGLYWAVSARGPYLPRYTVAAQQILECWLRWGTGLFCPRKSRSLLPSLNCWILFIQCVDVLSWSRRAPLLTGTTQRIQGLSRCIFLSMDFGTSSASMLWLVFLWLTFSASLAWPLVLKHWLAILIGCLPPFVSQKCYAQ